MYDTRADGVDSSRFDTWYYLNPGAPISLYLKSAMIPSMAEFRAVVKEGLPSSLHSDVDKLFRLSSIIP
jgi:hypothetical protein